VDLLWDGVCAALATLTSPHINPTTAMKTAMFRKLTIS
jgi:hypothetical protein